MWPFSRPKRVEEPPPPRLRALVARIDDVELELDHVKDLIRTMNARITTKTRKEPAQDAPGATNDDGEVVQYPPPPPPNTAHLARRFRS